MFPSYTHTYTLQQIPDVQRKCRTNDVHLLYKIVLRHPENITFEQGFYIYLGESTKRIYVHHCTSLSHKLSKKKTQNIFTVYLWCHCRSYSSLMCIILGGT